MAGTKPPKLLGGHPALDYLNTLDWRLSEEPGERIGSFADLAAFARRAGLIDAAERRALESSARRRPKRAGRVLRQARELRELGYRLVEALLRGRRPGRADLRRLNELAARPGCRASVGWEGSGFVWELGSPADDPERLLHVLVRSLVELLTSPESRLVAQCQDDRGCGWVFLDRSRGRARRWCSMADCGNRAKARRHYRRGARG